MSTKPYRNSRLAQFVTRRVLELKSRPEIRNGGAPVTGSVDPGEKS